MVILMQSLIPQEFEKQSEIMDMKEEMMNDSIDEAMEADDDESERYVSSFFLLWKKSFKDYKKNIIDVFNGAM